MYKRQTITFVLVLFSSTIRNRFTMYFFSQLCTAYIFLRISHCGLRLLQLVTPFFFSLFLLSHISHPTWYKTLEITFFFEWQAFRFHQSCSNNLQYKFTTLKPVSTRFPLRMSEPVSYTHLWWNCTSTAVVTCYFLLW